MSNEITEFDQPGEIISKLEAQIDILETQQYAIEEYYQDRVSLLEKEVEKATACIKQYHAKLLKAEQTNAVLSQALKAASPLAFKLVMQCMPEYKGD